MPVDGVGWSQVVPWLWEKREDVWKLVKDVVGWFRRPTAADGSDRGILIIGPGGVGKTTLARILSGDFNWLLDDPWRYDESYAIEQTTLEDDARVRLVIPPGQRNRREATWRQLLANVSAGQYRGVVFVAADGYHTISRQSYKAHPLYAGNRDAFVNDYLAACRRDEVEVLRRIAPHLETAPGKMWVLTVVTKEDLWFPERAEVEHRYATGEFADLLSGVATAKGTHNFRSELVPASLVISNFVTGDGETLSKNVAGYDLRKSVESVRRLFEVLRALCEWESAT